jgi:hypothetical protein
MIELLWGVLLGAVAGIWFDIVLAAIVRREASVPGSRAESLLKDRSVVLLFSPLVFFHSLWTLAGLLLGVVLWALTRDADGSDVSVVFILVIAATSAIFGLAGLAQWRKHAAWILNFVIAFFLLFGLALPFWEAATR